ncbi:DUF6090 family protein [Aestuariivivens sediminis]|uniref:DUF6090 family protein n=1 Tax=Aestuariivivens sediminis TaxID=2913557 RepID=UPI001F569A2B|nr:DUF6090 family protein [Aestuariivivens sediminis]
MITFFRKLRQQLLSDGKTGTYVKYAIGEIILVVIGILIALAINNWNENRKAAITEIKVLKEISENLGVDLLSLQNDIRLNEEGIKTVQDIEGILDSNGTLTDALTRSFGSITFNPTYTLNTSGYKNLSNIGFQIIVEDSIRKAITYLYETQYSFLKEREETAEKVTYVYLTPQFQEYFGQIKFEMRKNQLPAKLYYPKNFEDLKNNGDFHRLLDYAKEIKYGNLYDLNVVLKDIRRIKTIIDRYLEDQSH